MLQPAASVPAWQPAPDFRGLEKVVQEAMKETRTPGAAVAVVRGGRVVFAKGFGVGSAETGAPVTPDMLFQIGSMTKIFTAALLVTLRRWAPTCTVPVGFQERWGRPVTEQKKGSNR